MDIAVSILICFLSVYGIFQLLYNFACSFGKSAKCKLKYSYRVIGVDDDTENLEGYIRNAAMKEEREPLIIVNYARDGETAQLGRILEGEFDIVRSMTSDEYMQYIAECE